MLRADIHKNDNTARGARAQAHESRHTSAIVASTIARRPVCAPDFPSRHALLTSPTRIAGPIPATTAARTDPSEDPSYILDPSARTHESRDTCAASPGGGWPSPPLGALTEPPPPPPRLVARPWCLLPPPFTLIHLPTSAARPALFTRVALSLSLSLSVSLPLSSSLFLTHAWPGQRGGRAGETPPPPSQICATLSHAPPPQQEREPRRTTNRLSSPSPQRGRGRGGGGGGVGGEAAGV